MVSPYPPLRDGIAAYAQQQVASLRREGHDVEVLSPGPSAAHYHLDLVGPRGALALAKRVAGYDLVIVQFHPDFFYPPGAGQSDRAAVGLALSAAFARAKRVEVVVHEVDYRYGRGTSPAALITRQLWRRVDQISVHSQSEVDSFREAFGVQSSHIRVVDPGATFVAHTPLDQAQARASLGIAQDATVFLSIGFIQPHKGFDRAVRAFSGMGRGGVRLDVVGSVRVEDPAFVRYADDLEGLAARIPGAHVHLGFVSDELFDRWIVASDVVVLPYREIWSSSVMERALLFGRRVIATRVGALVEQAHEEDGVTIVDDDAGLRKAMRREAGGSEPVVEVQPWPSADAGRDAIQAQVVLRAARRRGHAVPLDGHGTPGPSAVGTGAVSAPLRRLGDVHLPDPGQGRGLRVLVRKAVRKVTAWQVQPVVDQVNAMRRASVESVERASETGPEAGPDAGPGAVPAPTGRRPGA